jgi:hypothetical protein
LKNALNNVSHYCLTTVCRIKSFASSYRLSPETADAKETIRYKAGKRVSNYCNPAGPSHPVNGVWGYRSTNGVLESTMRYFPETCGLLRTNGGHCPAWWALPEVAEDRELQCPTNHKMPFTLHRSFPSVATDLVYEC